MKKLLCFSAMSTFFCAYAYAVPAPKTLEQHLKNKVALSEHEYSNVTWKQATDNYKFCKEDTKKWELKVESKEYSEAHFSCEIKDDVAVGLEGYGKYWQLPVRYLLKVKYSPLGKTATGATIIEVYDPFMKQRREKEHLFMFKNFLNGESPAKIVLQAN